MSTSSNKQVYIYEESDFPQLGGSVLPKKQLPRKEPLDRNTRESIFLRHHIYPGPQSVREGEDYGEFYEDE